jgi:hypothetical protein
MRILGIGVIAAMLLMVAVSSLANTMRCGRQYVKTGDAQYDVLRKCGQPAYRDGSHWVYLQGRGTYEKIVVFQNGRVFKINLGEKQ